MRVQPGDRLDGRYEIRALLAEGGVSEVYQAIDHETAREVVVKMPRVQFAGDLVAFNRFRREAEIIRGLDHAGIQRLVSDQSVAYLVFEYVEGESLRKYLSRNGPLPVEDVQRIGVQLADTLLYSHQRGVVHRDLKPENILVGPGLRATLTDFGIATRATSRRLILSHLSDAVGTPDYMAPEQVRGEQGDARIDVYALGCVLYELLAGVVPYPAEAANVGGRDPPLVRRARPDTPPALEAILYRAVRRRPAERYQSMADMEYDLAHLNSVVLPDKYELDDPPPPPLGDLPPWRTTLTILAIVLGVLLLIGVLAQLAHPAAPSP